MLQCMKRRFFSCSRFHVRLFVFDLQNASLHLQALKITLVCVYRISSHGKMSATYSWLRGWDMKISCVTSLQRSTEPTWRRSCGLSQSFMKGWEHILSTYRMHTDRYINPKASLWWGIRLLCRLVPLEVFQYWASLSVYLKTRKENRSLY